MDYSTHSALRNVRTYIDKLPYVERCAIIDAALAGDTDTATRLLSSFVFSSLSEGFSNERRAAPREQVRRRFQVPIAKRYQQAVLLWR